MKEFICGKDVNFRTLWVDFSRKFRKDPRLANVGLERAQVLFNERIAVLKTIEIESKIDVLELDAFVDIFTCCFSNVSRTTRRVTKDQIVVFRSVETSE